MKILTLDEWTKEAKALFGDKIEDWKFVYPNCKQVQSYQDFLDNDVKDGDSKFFFSCIGRTVYGRGCDWTLGGLLQVHKTEVIKADGTHIPVFEFAKPK